MDIERLCDLLKDCKHAATVLPDEFRWTKDAAYQRSGPGLTERVSGGGTSDPTGDLATSPRLASTNSLVRQAAQKVLRARDDLIAAQYLLRSAMGDTGPLEPSDDEPEADKLGKPEMDILKAAQKRRQARNEGTGW